MQDINNKKIFAITVPCYNSELTIEETLNAILKQGKYLDFVECLILSDDGSKDNTKSVAMHLWGANTPRLIINDRLKNVGEMINVNLMVNAIPLSVQWFLHMHGDNIPKEDWLKVLIDHCLAAGDNVGIVCASYDVIHENGTVSNGDNLPDHKPVVILGNIASVVGTLKKGCWWHNSCTAVRVSAFKEIGGFVPGMRQKGDWDFLLRLLDAGWDIEYLKKTIMFYRLHENSASGFALKNNLDIEESLQVFQKYANKIGFIVIFSFHFNIIFTLFRRLMRSVLNIDYFKFSNCIKKLFRTFFSFFTCLTLK